MSHRWKQARLLVPLLVAIVAGTEFVPSLDPCPLLPRAAAVRPDLDLIRPGRQPLYLAAVRSAPPSDTGYDCPLYDRETR
jgi:hypothetical protein